MPTTNRLWTSQTPTYFRAGQSLPTARSRTGTAPPPSQTAVSVIHDDSYMIALLECRGVSREVGIAALDKDTGKVMLVQVITVIDLIKLLLRIYSLTILGRRLSNICKITTPNTPSQSIPFHCSSHFSIHFAPRVHSRRVSKYRDCNRWTTILE